MCVAFVLDGGPAVGMGHVYETVTLVADAPDSEDVVAFLEREGEATRLLARNDIPTRTFETAADLRDQLATVQPETVVFDHPDLAASTLRTVADGLCGTRIVGIGNTETNLPTTAGTDCDVVVNYSKDITSFDGVRREADGCLFLEGPAYFIIRPEFVGWEDAWSVSASVSDLLLLFGGSDPSNYSTRVLDRLLDSRRGYDIDVILGPGFSHHDAFSEVLDAHDTASVTVHTDVDDVRQYMLSCDVLLSSPGLTTFEALYVGCPVAAICQTAAHTTAYHDVPFAYEYEEITDVDRLVMETHDRFSGAAAGTYEVGTRRDEIVDEIFDGETQ